MIEVAKVEQIMQLYVTAKRKGEIKPIRNALDRNRGKNCWSCGALIMSGKICSTCYAMPPKDR